MKEVYVILQIGTGNILGVSNQAFETKELAEERIKTFRLPSLYYVKVLQIVNYDNFNS